MGFALDIQKFAKKCGSNADLVVRKTVMDIGRSLVEKTPVGNPDMWQNPDAKPPGYVGGHARSNWIYSTGTRVVQEIAGVDPSGEKTNERIAASVPVKASGMVHFIQNSVPYIQRLEDGHSKQAPAGMVSTTEVEFQGMIKNALAELK
jgi:hypothetical protein